MSVPRAPAPWTGAQARVVGACDVVAVLLVVAAWYAARQEDSLQAQVPWLNLAVVGLLVATVANGFLFLLARRAVGQRRLEVLPDVIARLRPIVPPTIGPRLWVAGTTRVHVDGCQMIAGKPAKPITDARVRSKGLLPCEICG